VTILEHTVNGHPGLVAQQDDVTVTVFAFAIEDGRITQHLGSTQPRQAPALDGALTRVELE
jgi:hypothetical protein